MKNTLRQEAAEAGRERIGIHVRQQIKRRKIAERDHESFAAAQPNFG